MPVTTSKPVSAPPIRPFAKIEVPDKELEALRARVAATRWPEKETVKDQSQGVQLDTIQAVARYWEKEYDWRKIEAKLNAVPHFITQIDGRTFTSFTPARSTRTRCRSSSPTDGPDRSSSSSRSSSR